MTCMNYELGIMNQGVGWLRKSINSIIHDSLFMILTIATFVAIVPQVAQAQGGFLPTPGESCNALKPNDQIQCRKAICPSKRICFSGKCITASSQEEFAKITKAELQNTLPCNYTIEDMVNSGVRMVTFIFGIAGSLTLLFFIYGGYTMLTSLGNPEEIQKGRKILTGALIGLVLILSAGFLVRFIASLVLPGPEAIKPGLTIAPGQPCGIAEVAKGMNCINGVWKTQCETNPDTAGLGYFCQPLPCLEDKECPGTYLDCDEKGQCTEKKLQCVKGVGCVTAKEAETLKPLECQKDLCPGSKYNQCCRTKPGV